MIEAAVTELIIFFLLSLKKCHTFIIFLKEKMGLKLLNKRAVLEMGGRKLYPLFPFSPSPVIFILHIIDSFNLFSQTLQT